MKPPYQIKTRHRKLEIFTYLPCVIRCHSVKKGVKSYVTSFMCGTARRGTSIVSSGSPFPLPAHLASFLTFSSLHLHFYISLCCLIFFLIFFCNVIFFVFVNFFFLLPSSYSCFFPFFLYPPAFFFLPNSLLFYLLSTYSYSLPIVTIGFLLYYFIC